jgi:hypothetical protein
MLQFHMMHKFNPATFGTFLTKLLAAQHLMIFLAVADFSESLLAQKILFGPFLAWRGRSKVKPSKLKTAPDATLDRIRAARSYDLRQNLKLQY